jgi:signal peptidase II
LKRALFSKIFALLSLVGIDALSKALAIGWIPPMQGSEYPFGGTGIFYTPFVSFSLNMVSNTGAAWGVCPDHFSLLLSLRICVAVFILVYLLFFASRSSMPLWLVLTGAIGNIVDMICYGHVIDFFHFCFGTWSFPIFNIADSCISIGVICLLIWPRKKEKVADAS